MTNSSPLPSPNPKNAVLAALLSALLCGLGQVYNGRKIRGIILFVLMCILWVIGGFFGAFMFGVRMIPFAIAVAALWLLGVLDAYAGSRPITRV